MITVLMLGLLVVLIVAFAYMARGRSGEQTDAQVRAWDAAAHDESSIIGRVLIGVSRPIAHMSVLYDQIPNRQYRALQAKLLASGAFGRDADVFIATQTGAVFVGLAVSVMGMLFAHGMLSIAVLVLGLALALYPYNILSKRLKARQVAVTFALPEFAELLELPLAMGQGIMSALRFTAERLDGPVSEEVRAMEALINSGAADEKEAFTFAGARLGTPEARSFFAALLTSQLEGSRVTDVIAAQAAALRTTTYQMQRAMVKRLPIKMVIMFGIHFMPLLFVVALIPTVYSLSHY